MRGKKIGPATEAAVRAGLLAGKSLRAVARENGVSEGYASTRLREAHSVAYAAAGMEMAGEDREWSEAGDTATVTTRTPEEVRTEADALRVCKVDTARWKVASMQIKTYQTAMKLRTGKETPDVTTVVQLFAVTLKLALIAPRPYLDAIGPLVARLEERAPHYQPPPGRDEPGHLCVLGLFDAHFAKLCWHKESGSDYDLRIAESVYRNAAEDLLRLASPYPIGRFVLPLGNDFFHIDSSKNATTNGTVVDTDSRYAKMVEIGEAAVIRLIERLQEVAPVDCFYVPGNHDRLSSYHLCRSVAAWFRHAPGVTMDLTPSVRKYRRYGKVLLGLRHGDLLSDSQLSTLPGLMAVESPRDWAEATCREWFLGHRHTSRRFVSRESDELQGVQIRYLSSLSGVDFWHHENGYIGNRGAAEAYLYSPDSGYFGHFVAPARVG